MQFPGNLLGSDTHKNGDAFDENFLVNGGRYEGGESKLEVGSVICSYESELKQAD